MNILWRESALSGLANDFEKGSVRALVLRRFNEPGFPEAAVRRDTCFLGGVHETIALDGLYVGVQIVHETVIILAARVESPSGPTPPGGSRARSGRAQGRSAAGGLDTVPQPSVRRHARPRAA
ncbi:MAG: hypothetical protein RID91_11920 [Azospirillaceae bacterium]